MLIRKNQKGQAVIIIVLITVVALTIGLSVAGRTTTDIKMSGSLEDSGRAFSAAEAGIESALLSGTGSNGDLDNALYTVRIRETSPSEFIYWGLNNEESFQLWLSDHDDMETAVYTQDWINVGWGVPNNDWQSTATTPAIELIVLYKESGLYKSGRYLLDPRDDRSNNFCHPNGDNCPSGKIQNFITSASIISGSNFQFSSDIYLGDFSGAGKTIQIIRGKLLYSSQEQSVGFKGLSGGTLPAQGSIIDSIGTSGQSTKRIQVFAGFETLPAVFDYGLFSSDSLTQ